MKLPIPVLPCLDSFNKTVFLQGCDVVPLEGVSIPSEKTETSVHFKKGGCLTDEKADPQSVHEVLVQVIPDRDIQQPLDLNSALVRVGHGKFLCPAGCCHSS